MGKCVCMCVCAGVCVSPGRCVGRSKTEGVENGGRGFQRRNH